MSRRDDHFSMRLCLLLLILDGTLGLPVGGDSDASNTFLDLSHYKIVRVELEHLRFQFNELAALGVLEVNTDTELNEDVISADLGCMGTQHPS